MLFQGECATNFKKSTSLIRSDETGMLQGCLGEEDVIVLYLFHVYMASFVSCTFVNKNIHLKLSSVFPFTFTIQTPHRTLFTLPVFGFFLNENVNITC